jgi:hypothetical protein
MFKLLPDRTRSAVSSWRRRNWLNDWLLQAGEWCANEAPALRSTLCVLLAGAAAAGCTVSDTGEYPSVEPEPIYVELFPYYASICALSQIRATFTEHGGTPGHAVMFLRGACKDEDATYPRLELCPEEEVETGDANFGTGISVNKTFRNVNWVLIEGRDMFFDGMLEPGEVLDEAHAREVLDTAIAEELWAGIEIHDKYKPPSDSDEDWLHLIAREMLGTDFACVSGATRIALAYRCRASGWGSSSIT